MRPDQPPSGILPCAPEPVVLQPLVFLPRREVIRRVGLSKSTIYQRMEAGTFPKPVHDLHTATVWWLEHEITEWQLARLDPARAARMGRSMGRNEEGPGNVVFPGPLGAQWRSGRPLGRRPDRS